MERVNSLASESAVVIFSKSSCCMCHTIKILFSQELGVRTVVHELDEVGSIGKEMERALARQLGLKHPVPAVYIGGEFVGSTNKVMSLHLEGTLVELLKSAGEEQTKKIKDMYKDIATNQAQSQEEEDTAEEG